MKTLIISALLAISAPVFASYHFQCYQVVGCRTADQMFLLIPNEADLTSGASFSLASEEGISENYSFVASKKGATKLQGSNGSSLKIESRGNERKMEIRSKDQVVTEYKCFNESSI
jgi:hypothetical protein